MNNANELVSIIMAAYNAEENIEAAIRSVQTQSYSNWELSTLRFMLKRTKR